LFGSSEGSFTLAEQSNTFIIAPFSPVHDEPIREISIAENVLKIDFTLWQSAGSWSTTDASYRFRFSNGVFQLIGADRFDSMRNSGETEERSYNFLTHKVKITKGNFESEKPETVAWRPFTKVKLRTLKTIPVPFEWEIEPDFFI
jgi:hypothetical protein